MQIRLNKQGQEIEDKASQGDLWVEPGRMWSAPSHTPQRTARRAIHHKEWRRGTLPKPKPKMEQPGIVDKSLTSEGVKYTLFDEQKRRETFELSCMYRAGGWR